MGDKSVKKQISFPFWRLIISILAFSFLVGIALFVVMAILLYKSTGCHCCHWWHCCFCGEAKLCNLEIVICVALVLVVIIVTLIFTAKALKPYAKMEFLKEIINKNIDNDYLQSLKDMELRDLVKEGIANQKDLIKKYCDTLADL